jgi:hypothetical protein
MNERTRQIQIFLLSIVRTVLPTFEFVFFSYLDVLYTYNTIRTQMSIYTYCTVIEVFVASKKIVQSIL